MSVVQLSDRVRRELTYLSFPTREWTIPRYRNGAQVLDVLIVGGGQGATKTKEPSQYEPAGNKTGTRVFVHIANCLPITGNERPTAMQSWRRVMTPLTYGALWGLTTETVRELRSFGLGRSDRVAVVLPDGPETAAALIAIAAGAVCVPLYPGFTADEWQR
jgi:hypothetical protein